MTHGDAAREALPPRVREAGDAAVLLELEPVIDTEVNARAVAIAAVLRQESLAGVRDVVSTFRSVAVYFDPLILDIHALRTALERASRASRAPAATSRGRRVDVPVVYGGDAGPDLDDVAAFAKLPPHRVIERHAGADYRVFMLGFLPGFAYMGTVPSEIAAPRRATPRLRVPAGSVAVAGRQTAVYPRESPGGWQIIGRTPVQLFDPARQPAALLTPGDAVRFIPTTAEATRVGPSAAYNSTPAADERPDHASNTARHITVLRPGLATTVQDMGRWGHLSSGVSTSGAMDLVSHRVANATVGNDRDAATLEVTLAGPELRLEAEATLALAGADLGATLNGATVPLNRAVRGRHGDVLSFGPRRVGARTYIAADGGIAVPAVLGSRATHALTAVGGVQGRPLVAGDRLALGAAGGGPPPPRGVELPQGTRTGGVRLRVMPGPQDEWFPQDAFDVLQRSRFTVGTQSNRMGYRLTGARIPRIADREMISDATFTGAIQVPASGEPILLMVDRQTTGGYPQIATVITADLPLAGQLAPGDWIEFQICSRADALAALVAQEGKLLAIR